ncbi:MAG: sigma 54-interacting transcriptional regulator, partial [Candidatus Hydrogenedentes bacterium]|nr:sigma 54-interacting transcriptional regulator [Candidatus Hydrogenedentota bacterium]
MARVLVVEDELVLRLTFEEFLGDHGYDVSAAEDYNQAVALLDHEDFDLIVTDIILAGKTGVDLLRTIRKRQLVCPVIMITGEPNVETAAEAVRLGAFDYLPKPVTRDALLRVTRLALDRKRLAEERDHYAAELDRYRRELEGIFNSVNEGIITVDPKMRIRQANSAVGAIFGTATCTFNGRLFAEALPAGIEPATQALEQTLRTHEAVAERRVDFKLAGGEEKVVLIRTTPLLGMDGKFVGAILMLRDITRVIRLERQLEESQQYRDIVGKSGKMQEIFRLIKDLAETDSTVLIIGDSGTGKELVANALHHSSARAGGPFLKVNCAALSEDILESELFGHVKGAFTGAVRDRIGRFEAANGGTILLDEIGDISPRLQLRLLRVLQEREFERVGSSTPIRTDVRVVASTNQNLEEKIRRGEFRQDLYYRLNVVRITIPPLRERREDIPLLIESFRHRFNKLLKKNISA